MPELLSEVRAKARDLGFTDVGVTTRLDDPAQAERLDRFIAEGHHGTMAWMETTAARRRGVSGLWPQARSALVLTMPYPPPADPFGKLQQRTAGVIAAYAMGRDYHDVVKGRLKQLAGWLAQSAGARVKVFVDTAPLMEKPLAQRAGVGWQGKHTNLVSRTQGSWTFLGVILTDRMLEDSEAESDHCGSCRACLDVCPTQAFPAPYRLDARRCISYLTIEHQGPIPDAFRKAIGNRVYGCDDCLAVCPWNKFAADAHEAKLAAVPDRVAPALADLANLGDAGFRAMFAASAIKRTGWARFLRNVLIAIGNSGDAGLINAARPHLASDDPVIRGAAVWALRQLLPPAEFTREARAHGETENDEMVRAEWAKAA